MIEAIELFRVPLFPTNRAFNEEDFHLRRNQAIEQLKTLIREYKQLNYLKEFYEYKYEDNFLFLVVNIAISDQTSLALDASLPEISAGESTLPLLTHLKNKILEAVERIPNKINSIVYDIMREASFNDVILKPDSDEMRQFKLLMQKNKGKSIVIKMDSRNHWFDFPDMHDHVVDSKQHLIMAKVHSIQNDTILVNNVIDDLSIRAISSSKSMQVLLTKPQINWGCNLLFSEAMSQSHLIQLKVNAFLDPVERYVKNYELIEVCRNEVLMKFVREKASLMNS